MPDYTDPEGGEWSNVATEKSFGISVRAARPPTGHSSSTDIKERLRSGLLDKVNSNRDAIIKGDISVTIVAGTFDFQMDPVSREKIQHTKDRFTEIETKRTNAGRSMTWRTADNQAPTVVLADMEAMIDEAESRWITTHDDAVDLKAHVSAGTQPSAPLMATFGVSQTEIDSILIE